ncbi:MAG TPA: hypothetical protein VHQ99_00080 [Gaiellaceae bacterium]|nr:hypothetical protein [Gaiellaceae bacterium]
MEALIAFAAALLALRLTALIARRWRATARPELAAWTGALFAYAVACAALAWGAAAGWDSRAFRAYYLFGGLLTAPLLGLGSLLLYGWRRVVAPALVYVGLAIGIAISMPVHGTFGDSIPAAQDHLELIPGRLVAIVANVTGTLAVLAVAIVTIRRRPVGNGLILAGVVVAALGTALSGLGEAKTAIFVAIAALLLYGGFTAPPRVRR